MTDQTTARKNPCGSCPYRANVPSGIWHEDEYRKLERYDGDVAEQATKGATAVFLCPQGEQEACTGWLGHRDPAELLAVRLGVAGGTLDPECLSYRTDAELHSSGEAAAAHGMADIAAPTVEAEAAIEKIVRVRQLPGRSPVQLA